MNRTDSHEAIAAEAKEWRRHIHRNPEILFDLPGTSAFVAQKLREFGCDEVVTGIATSGVVGVVKGRGAGRTLGFRADMDALPMSEETNLPYASSVPDRMHACGHDGHTAMLLAAARELTLNRDFAGTVVLIFQPAEEGGGGGRVMIEEGLLERFGIDEVYAMHNQPGLDVGAFETRPGPLLAAGDRFVVTLSGRGGHAAEPHRTPDALLATAHLVTAAQSIASRFTDPFDPVVVSLTYISGGNPGALNVIPASVQVGGTARTVNAGTRSAVEARFREIAAAAGKLFGVEVEVDWRPGYPVTVNDPAKTAEAIAAARAVAGAERVDGNCAPTMGSEDFSYMLEKRPGAMVWIGNGDSANLHQPAYDFDDGAIIHGMRFWRALVDRRLGAAAAD